MRLYEYMIIEKTTKPIAIFVGRISPITVAHQKIIADAIKKYHKLYVVIVEGYATSKLEKNFLTFQDRVEMLKITNSQAEAILTRNGYIPTVISDNNIPTNNGIVIIAGTDRISGYKIQFKDVDYEVTFDEMKRTDDDVSASKVRQALMDDNYKEYTKMIAKGLDNKKYFELLKRALKVKGMEQLESKEFNWIRPLLTEGGNAVKESVPINQKNAKATVENIFKKVLPLLNITEDDVLIGGSLMKKLTPSGDIDILISVPSLIKNNKDVNDIEDIYKFVTNQVKKISSYSVLSKGIGVISLPFPISNTDGEQEGATVQLDLMFTDDLDWSKFSYHTPFYYESKWKTVYRFILLTACIKYASMNITKKDASGKPMEWSKIIINKDKGLLLVKQMIDDRGKIKEVDRNLMSFNPADVVKLFGDNVTENDLTSFEKIMDIIQSKDYPFNNKLKDILSDTAKGIKNIGMVVPDELEKYLTEQLLFEGLNPHITHLEDNVFQGKDGIERSLEFIEPILATLKGESKAISTKFDGSPAAIYGPNPENGKFFVSTKAVFAKVPKVAYSEKEVDELFNEGVAKKLKEAFRYLKQTNPTNIYQGDLMFTSGDKKLETIDGKQYITFTPNTITYAVPSDSKLANDIAVAKIGIVVHTRYKGELGSLTPVFDVKAEEFKKVSSVWLIDAFVNDVSSINIDETEMRQIEGILKVIDNNKSVVEKIDNNIVTLLMTYKNNRIKSGVGILKAEDGLKDFKEYVETVINNDKISDKGKEAKRIRLFEYIDNNANNIILMFKIYNWFVKIKMIVLKKLNQIESMGTFLKQGDGYKVTAPEGFVAIGADGSVMKLVDRLEFSKNNFTMPKSW